MEKSYVLIYMNDAVRAMSKLRGFDSESSDYIYCRNRFQYFFKKRFGFYPASPKEIGLGM